MKTGVYIITHPHKKQVYKIGCSNNLSQRLNSSDYTIMFYPTDTPKLKYIFYFNDERNIMFFENAIHNILKQSRLFPNRELFKLPQLNKTIKLIQKSLTNDNILHTLHKTLNTVPDSHNIPVPITTLRSTQYDYQIPIIEKLLLHYNTANKGVLSCPPGFGKTYIASQFINQSNYHNYLILCPQILICDEFKIALSHLTKNNKQINITVVNSDNKEKIIRYKNKKNIIITTYQSYPLYKIKNINCTIYDEAHHTCCGPQFTQLLKIKSTKKLFITATPKIVHYIDTKRIQYSMNNPKIYGKIIHQEDLNYAINKKLLCDYKIYFPSVDLADPINICRKIISKYDRRRIVLFFNSIIESKKIAEILSLMSIGDSVFELNGNSTRKKKLQIKKIMDEESDKVYILCNVNIIGEGVSIKLIDSIVFCENRSSPIGLYQNIGRGLRWHKNKNICMIVVNNTFNAKNVFSSLYEYDSSLRNNNTNEYKLIGDDSTLKKYVKTFQLIKIEQNGGLWNYKFEILLNYIKKFSKIPHRSDIHNGVKIRTWFDSQLEKITNQKSKTYIKMNKDKIIKYHLDKYIEKKTDDKYSSRRPWNSVMNMLLEYVTEKGKMPEYREKYKNYKLGYWLGAQKKKIKDNTSDVYIKMSKNKIIKKNLDEYIEYKIKNKNKVKFTWEENMDILCEYIDQYKKIPMRGTLFKNHKFGCWLSDQKKKLYTQSDELYHKLNRNITLENNLNNYLIKKKKNKNKIKYNWDESLKMLLEYIQLKKCIPTIKDRYNNYSITTWLNHQLKYINNQSDEMYKKLNKHILIKKYLDAYIKNKIERNKYKISQNDKMKLLIEYVNDREEIPSHEIKYKNQKIGYWLYYHTQKLTNTTQSFYKSLSHIPVIKQYMDAHINSL